MIELHDIKIINTTLLIYLCNEMIHMHGYDCYDYGARHSQTALGRFTTMDPLAEKYYGISPYALCGGNPVRYVDWDGKEIKIGTWYGRLLARFGVDNFESKVQRQINTIRKASPQTMDMVNKLEISPEIYHIKQREGGRTNYYSVDEKTVFFDPDDQIGHDGEKRPAEAGLAHELGHAEDDNDGVRVPFDKREAKKGDQIEMEKCQKNEFNAIDKENDVRESMDYPLRDYSYFTARTK